MVLKKKKEWKEGREGGGRKEGRKKKERNGSGSGVFSERSWHSEGSRMYPAQPPRPLITQVADLFSVFG